MLTREQIENSFERCRLIYTGIPQALDLMPMRRVADQAVLAISLAEENERLQTRVQYLGEGADEVNEANDELQAELTFTQKFIHDNGMEFELLHQWDLAKKKEG